MATCTPLNLDFTRVSGFQYSWYRLKPLLLYIFIFKGILC
nr:MAG TPA: hypothetical protein [Caudoviricetes sp.]